jgi:hypothetical protein
MDSDINVGGGYGDVFAGPAAGHVPTAWEQFSGDRNADAAETAMGAGPAIDALRKMSRAQEAQNSKTLRWTKPISSLTDSTAA